MAQDTYNYAIRALNLQTGAAPASRSHIRVCWAWGFL